MLNFTEFLQEKTYEDEILEVLMNWEYGDWEEYSKSL